MTTQRRKMLEELARRKARAEKAARWFSTSFPAQLAFVNDKSPLVAALCTRRAGKSSGVGEDVMKLASENPYVSFGIIGKTRQSIKNIYFKDIIRPVAMRMGWVENKDYWINKTELSVELSNGAMIYFAGADSNEDEMNKFLGQKFMKVYIDEASMYAHIDLKNLVEEILEPAVSDYDGQVVMIGTPSNYVNSYYHKVTEGKIPGWSVHKWTWADNPHVADKIKARVEQKLIDNPRLAEDPGFRQHWYGEWVVDLGARIYKYDPKHNKATKATFQGYQTILGVDLGYEDDTAFVVGAWSSYDPVLHIIHCESAPKLDLDQVESRMKALQARFNIGIITVDGAGKQFVETLQNRFQIALHRAEKVQKKDFIELMNTDFLMGRIDVFHDNCLPLVSEWESLIWDMDVREKTGEWKEDRKAANHAADAALYMWRWCHHYAQIPKIAPPTEEQVLDQKHYDKITKETNESDTIAFHDSDLDFGF